MKSLNYSEALDVSLCYGWIDGQADKFDDAYYIQRFTPRRKKSQWSKRNTGHAERLIKEGRMKPSGMEQVNLARKDGRWESAYHSSSTAKLPEGFALKLSKFKRASAFYESLTNANKYAIIYRLTTAKKPETLKNREDQILKMLKNGETFH